MESVCLRECPAIRLPSLATLAQTKLMVGALALNRVRQEGRGG